MKPLRFLAVLFILLLPLSASAQTFHMIIFADTNDKNIGSSVGIDAYNIADMGAIISSAIGMENHLNQLFYVGKDCSTANLLRLLNDIEISRDDIVVFYYSGHGGRAINDKSPYPQMCMTVNQPETKFVSLEAVDRALAKKNPRFRLIVADCCNSMAEQISAKDELPQVKLGATNLSKVATSYYRDLFCNYTGKIVCCASKAGETALCVPIADYGSLFTEIFVNVLEISSENQQLAEWTLIMANTREQVSKFASEKLSHTQTPVFEVDISGINRPIEPAQSSPNTNNEILNILLSLVNHNLSASERIRLVEPAYKKYFANNAMIETVGRNHTTTLDYEPVKDFLERISTSFNLNNFSIVSQEKDEQGKIVRMKIHEIYKEH